MKNNQLAICILLILIFFLTVSSFTFRKIYTSIDDALANRERAKALIVNTCSKEDVDLFDSIYLLKNLKYLEISECAYIRKIPENLDVLKLKSFKFFWNGTGIENFDYSTIGGMKELKLLKLGPYGQIRELPQTFSNLTNLKELDLQLTGIQYIPNWIDTLRNLEVLDISRCSRIDSLPVKKLNQMKKLRVIKLYDSKMARNKKYISHLNENLNCNIEY